MHHNIKFIKRPAFNFQILLVMTPVAMVFEKIGSKHTELHINSILDISNVIICL